MSPSYRFDAYIFDLDGTLTDSSRPIGAGLVRALEAAGISGVTAESTHHWIGRPLTEIFAAYRREAGLAEPDEELFAAMLTAYREGHDEIFLAETLIYQGALEALEALRTAGKRIAVATTKYQEAAEFVLGGLEMEGLVDAICGTDPGEPVKPHPFVVHKALDALAADAGAALFVGDTPADILAAHNAATGAAAAAWGFGDREQLAAAGPEFWLESFADLP
jgi:phosphoglycolate phosphatase